MYLFTISAAATATLLLVAAAFLLFTQKKYLLLNIFIIYLAVTALWIAGNAATDIAPTVPLTLLFAGITWIAGAFEVSFFILFIHVFIYERLPSRAQIILFFLPALLTSPFAFSSYSIEHVILHTDQPNETFPGPIYLIGFVTIFTYLIFSFYQIIAFLRHATDLKRTQAVYILIGFSSLLIGQLIFTVVLPILGELRFYTAGPQFALIFAYCTGYAILKHKLIDFKIIFQRSLIYTVLFSIIVCIYALALVFTTKFYSIEQNTILDILSGVIAILFSLYTIPRLDAFLRRATDPIFYSDRYEYEKALHELSQTLSESADLNTIISHSESALERILRASVITIGNKSKFSNVELSIMIPGSKKAQIFIGPKKSGSPYTTTDKLLLETFANQASVAIERALLFKDIKERAQELERRVEERTQKIKTIQEQQKAVMLQLTHNLQTPLAILTTHFERLRGRIQNQDFASLELSVKDVSSYIARLLRLARLENRQEPTIEVSVSLSNLMQEVIEEVSIIAESHYQEIIYSYTPDLYVRGDQMRIREAIMNIISNALKYASGNQPIQITLKKYQKQAQIICKNYGSFLSKVDLENIFTAFYRSKGHDSITGTGLGLAITKEIVEQHGGKIYATSSKAGGTSFIINLPLESRPKTDHK